MRLLTILPALTLILATLNAMAYNSKNCAEKIIYQSAVKQKNFSAYMGQATIGSSSSSTSYVSSTGPCKAFGQIRYERTYMIANAWGELKGQAAKGSGEHLQALSSLYGCNSQDQFSKFVNSHYSQIFDIDINTKTPSNVQLQLESMIQSSPTSLNCQIVND